MPKLFVKIFISVLLAAVCAACAKTPYTGRSQFIIVSESEEMQLGQDATQDILKKEKVSKDPELNARVRRIGTRIAEVSIRPDFEWEFYVIENDETANAFCLPGGKVFVYTGIMKFAQNDDQLATVMGHEIAHALARHGVERMSMQMAAQAGGAIGSAVLGGSSGTSQIFQQAYGIAANVGVLLPYSRAHEHEADEIGLELMARAGYDPEEAVRFWENMKEGHKGKERPPAFLSTHPPDEERIENLRALLPWAKSLRPR